MNSQTSHVSTVLSQTAAHLWRQGRSSSGLRLAEWEWRGATGWANYEQPGHHTLSLYLEGGERISRVDRPVLGGAPDKFCLMPAGQGSRWRVDGPVRMLHLYIDPAVLAYQARLEAQVDPGHITLKDLTFADDPAIAMIVRGALLPLNWNHPADRIALDAACHLLIHRLLRHHRVQARQSLPRSGLAPSVQKRIVDHIEAHLGTTLTLDDLAREANLSTFHFARMFRQAMGVPPHAYIARRRVDRAKQLLSDRDCALAQVALACGYASQSHFTRAFKEETGVTPGAWRRLV